MNDDIFEDVHYLELVYQKLFELLKKAQFPDGYGLNSQLRAPIIPDNLPSVNQPAMLMIDNIVMVDQKQQGVFGPAKWTLAALVVILARADVAAQPVQLPSTVMNYFLWGIRKVLENTQPPYQRQTLGGLVYHCWIEGEIHTEIENEQMQLTIPIYILPGSSGP